MDKGFGVLVFLGILFISLGFWLWLKDKKRMELMEVNLTQKEESLYELYLALEEIMMELISISKRELTDKKTYNLFENHDSDLSEEESANNMEYPVIKQIDPNDYRENPLDMVESQEMHINKYERIVSLKDKGHSHEEIARKLNIGVGEVNLILEFTSGDHSI